MMTEPTVKENTSLGWRIRFRYIIWPRITRPFKRVSESVVRYLTVQRAALVLILLALGFWYYARVPIDDLWPNIIPELLSISITVLIIDALYRRRSDDQLKGVLIKQLGSRNNAVATVALSELDARDWLSDGSLEGAFLLSANLDNNTMTGADMKGVHLSFASLRNTTWFEADLESAALDHADLRSATLSMRVEGGHFVEANLKDATLFEANLSGAQVRHEQLVQAKTVWRAQMKDGKRYDGRYNSEFDLEMFRNAGMDVSDSKSISNYYGVSESAYLEGQEWAKNNPHLFE